LPKEPTKIFASDFASAVGGPAANGAVTVARQGGRSSLWARIGRDMQGDRILAELAADGVGVAQVRQVEGGRSGSTAVAVAPDGERMLLVFADPTLDPDPSGLPLDAVGRHDAVLADLRWPAASRNVLRQARRDGVPAVLDADLSSDATALPSLIPLASHVIFSEPALRAFSGTQEVGEALAAAFDREAHAVAGVTLGERGCAWLDRGGLHEEPGLAVAAVDTLAAGDVFHGAYALALARRLSARDCARFANLVAAVKCTRWGGGAGIPSRDDVATFVRDAGLTRAYEDLL
jgi:sulfofructose kinase